MTKADLNCGIKNEQVLRQRASKGDGNFAFPRLTSHWQHIDSLSKYQRRSFAVPLGWAGCVMRRGGGTAALRQGGARYGF